jgi:multimeric flavodoxin WrbA
MKVTILDGSSKGDPIGEQVAGSLHRILGQRSFSVSSFVLRNEEIHRCAGDFYCWVRYPGQCMHDDANRKIAAATVGADLVVYLTPVTFGGYSSSLKSMVDHEIQSLSPFFTSIGGETHHQKRYQSYPDLLAVGWNAVDEDEADVFRFLVRRNQINFHSGTAVAGVLPHGATAADISRAISTWLVEVLCEEAPHPAKLPDGPIATSPRPAIRQSALLVGSPRARQSSSYHLGAYLQQRLADAGVITQTSFVSSSLRSEARWASLLDVIESSDLLILAYPLYVDSLPTPVVEAMERIVNHRRDQEIRGEQRLLAIANCGFPEAEHNLASLAMCRQFARQAGFDWVGGLSLGGGQGAVQAQPLEEGGFRVRKARRALEITAAALLDGGTVPQRARALMATPFIPRFLYRAVGSMGWRSQARRWGVQRQLDAMPYVSTGEADGSLVPAPELES